MKTATKFFLLLTFFGFFSFFSAQESKEVLELKRKAKNATDKKTKNESYLKLIDAYANVNADSSRIYAEKTLPYLDELKDDNLSGRVNLMIGRSYLMNAEFDKSFKFLKNAEKNLGNVKDYNSLGMLNQMFSGYYLMKKNVQEATSYSKKTIQYFNQKKNINKQLVLGAYQNIFSSNFSQNNFKEAYQSYNEYLEFVKKDYPEQLNFVYLVGGIFYMQTSDNNKAISYFNKSIAATPKNNLDFINSVKNNIGLTYIEIKKIDSAYTYLNETESYFSKNNNPKQLSYSYYGLANYYEKKSNFSKAEFYIEKALQLAPEKDLENSKLSFNVLKNRILLSKIKNSNNIENYKDELNKIAIQSKEYKELIDNSESWISPNVKIENLENLSLSNELLANYKDAYNYYQMSIEEKDLLYDKSKLKDLSNTQSDYELREQKSKIELQEQTKRLQLQKEIELKALKFEYDKKQATAKTEAERKRLMLEEDLKRKEIQIKFDEEQKAIMLKYNQEKQLAKINQEKKDAVAKAELESSKSEKNMWAIGAGLSLLLLGFAGFSYFQKQKDNKKIAEEKQKSDDLLLNILPHEVAEELKEKGKTSAKHYDEVSVLFTDFVSFTANSEKLGVQEVLNELNVCFTEFDRIMERNGLEKIKTIGDAYLAVSGLPVSNEQHAKNAVNAGIEILEFIEKRKKENPTTLDIRIGVHSGPVIAGIVGVKKFAYDIWGDTVNTAARMEQNSQKGKLNISGSTYDLVKDKFTCEHRGKIETKGKGALDMYFVSENKSLI